MVNVPTILDHSNANVTLDILEMGLPAQVQLKQPLFPVIQISLLMNDVGDRHVITICVERIYRLSHW